jgi:O-antigen/teichoic acid export membrane protein
MTEAASQPIDLTPEPALEAVAAPGFLRLSMDSVVYSLGSLLGKAFGLLMLPFLARLLTPADFGRADVLFTLGSAAISALLLGLDSAATRLYFDDRPAEGRHRLFASWAILAGIIVVPAALVISLRSDAISAFLFGTDAYARAVSIVGLVLVFGTFHHFTLTLLRAMQRPVAFAIVSGVALSVNAVLSIWLLTTREPAIDLVIAALAVGLAIGTLVGVALLGTSIFVIPSWRDAALLLSLGLPLAPAIAATWFAESANRAILVTTSGPTEVANLAVALRIASIAALAVAGYQLAWQPRAFALGTSPGSRARLGTDASRILISVAALAAIVALFSREAIQLLAGGEYQAALPAVGLSLLGVIAAAAFLVTSLPSAMGKRMKDIGIASVAGVALAVALNIVLAPRFGAPGTAAALAASPLAAALVVRFLGRAADQLLMAWLPVLATVTGLGGIILASTLAPEAISIPVRLGCVVLAIWILLRQEATRDLMRFVRGHFRA